MTQADEVTFDREFRIVMRGPSAVIFRQRENWLFEKFPTEFGPVNIGYASRWLTRAEAVTVPGHLWIEVRGYAPELERAISPFANAGLAGISIVATSANAAVGEPEVEVAFESTPGAKEREYFQSYVPPETGVLHTGRLIDLPATLAFLNSLKAHKDADRLLRATNQYNFALRNWKFGHATISLAHLWMTVEALTKVKLRAECAARRLSEPKELAASLGIELRDLDAMIRRQFILQGDTECYTQAKEASDGFEHGYLGFDQVLELSQQVRHRMAIYVRRSIFDLAGVEEDAKARLLSNTFAKPLGHWPVVKYLRGTLQGNRDELAAPGNEYPFMRWATGVKKCEFDSDGKLQVQLDEKLTAELAEGISFSPKSFEAWRPD
ncbi:MAG: hypothetical protein ACRD8U_17250 [Pyrinomonadaceae bacterium]